MDKIKILLEEICKTQRELSLLDNKPQLNQGIFEYNRNLTHEWEKTDEACRAKERKYEYELRQRDLEEREAHYLDRHNAGKKTQESLNGRTIILEKRIAEAVKKLEKFQTWNNFDKQTVNDFLGEMVQKEDDEMIIVKYVLQDEQRIKSFTQAIEKLELDVMRKCKSSNTGVMETKSEGISVAKTKDNLMKVDMRRGKLDQLCTNTRMQLQQRNGEMQQYMQQLVHVLQNVRPKKEDLTEKKNVFEWLSGENTRLERKLDVADRRAVKPKQELREQEDVYSKLDTEFAAVNAEHNSHASRVKSLRAHTSTLTTEKWDTANTLDKAERLNAAREERLRVKVQMAPSDEQRAAQIEKHMEDLMAEIVRLGRELDGARRATMRGGEELKAFKTMEKDSVAAVSRAKCRILVFVKQKLDKNVQIKHRHLAEQGAIIDDRIHTNAEMQNIITNEARMLAGESTERSEVMEQRRKAAKIQANAVREIEDDTRFLLNESGTSEAQMRDLINKADGLRLFCITKKEEQTGLRLMKEEKLVDSHIVNVEVQRKRNLLYNETNDMHSLKTRKLDIQSVLKDSKLERMVYSQSLEFQLRTAEQENRTVRVELSEDLSKVNMLETRFEVTNLSKTASPVDYITEAVKEREGLQRKEDHLCAEICKIKQENERLEITLEKITLDISAFERPLYEGNEPCPEHQEVLQLEQHLNRVVGMDKLAEGEIQDLLEKFLDVKETSESLEQEAQGKEQELQFKQPMKTKLIKDISSQQIKIERVSKQMTTKKAVNLEQDAVPKLQKECIQGVMEHLKKAANVNSELKELLEKSFVQADVHVVFQG